MSGFCWGKIKPSGHPYGKTTKQGGEPVESISLLTTLDQKYLPQLRTLLTSLSINNPGEIFDVFLFHSGLTEENLSDV